MAKSGLRHIDVGAELTKTEWESEESHELIHGTSFPSSPVERQLFYRDDEHKWYIYNGTEWVWLGGGGGMEVHGNEYHDPDFEQQGVAATLVETHRTTEVHIQDQPPAEHGNEKHDPDFATESALSSHASATTGVHGVGGDTVGIMNKDKTIQDADGDTKIQVEESADEDKIHMDVKGVEAFLLHDDGIIDLAKQSAFHGYLPEPDQTLSNDTWTQIELGAEVYDNQGEFNTGTYRFTAKKTGTYLFLGKITFAANATGQRGIRFRQNDSVNYTQYFTALSSGPSIFYFSIFLRLTANDFVDFYGFQDSGGDLDIDSGENATFMAGVKLL